MSIEKSYAPIRILTLITYLVMVTVNALANIIPINGVGTGEVSDAYENLFAPAGVTFAIWGLIYFLLGGYTLYQIGFFRTGESAFKGELFKKVGEYFSISSIANAMWIFAWHYNLIPLSMILMVVILICLIKIAREINGISLSDRDRFFIRLPFSVYFGWITVATIANATTLLVSLGWRGFGISEPVWTVLIVVVGLMIGLTITLRYKDIAYGLVIIWAYAGILLKHVSENGFSGQYPEVITTVIVCIVLMSLTEGYVLISNRK